MTKTIFTTTFLLSSKNKLSVAFAAFFAHATLSTPVLVPQCISADAGKAVTVVQSTFNIITVAGSVHADTKFQGRHISGPNILLHSEMHRLSSQKVNCSNV